MSAATSAGAIWRSCSWYPSRRRAAWSVGSGCGFSVASGVGAAAGTGAEGAGAAAAAGGVSVGPVCSDVQAAAHSAASAPQATGRQRAAPRISVLTGMRQLNVKVGARAVVQQFDLAAVRGDVLVHDRKAYAAAALGVTGLALAAVKRFEHARPVGRGDAWTLVHDVDAGPARQARHGKLDGSAPGAEAYGIGQEVTKGHAQLVGVDLRLHRLAPYHDSQLPGHPLQALLSDQLLDERSELGASVH